MEVEGVPWYTQRPSCTETGTTVYRGGQEVARTHPGSHETRPTPRVTRPPSPAVPDDPICVYPGTRAPEVPTKTFVSSAETRPVVEG